MMTNQLLNLRAGDVAEIRSKEEIRSTLDERGNYEGLPFMDEMWQYCGKRYRVFRRAEKVCVESTLLRQMENAVFLEEIRCDGNSHDACDRACLIFWKEAWLRKVEGLESIQLHHAPNRPLEGNRSVSERGKAYSCQSTSIMTATTPLSRWDLKQYVRDVVSGNFTTLQVLRALFISTYNRISRVMGGREYGAATGDNSRTPVISLNLQPGEFVEIRSRDEISATIDKYGKNRGLFIDYEMLRHAGKQFRVLKRVDNIILETTGKMRNIENTVLLEGTACEGLCRRACARNSYPMWREAWLKRVETTQKTLKNGN